MSEIIIRDAIPLDSTGIAIVQAYTWLTTYAGLIPDDVLSARVDRVPQQAEYIAARIGQGDVYAVAVCGSAVVGFACASSSRNESFPKDGEIQGLYVLKGFQGRGVGKSLFENCARKLRANGHEHLIVNCLEGNPSEKFYLRMGGSEVGTREDALRGGHVIREKIIRFDI